MTLAGGTQSRLADHVDCGVEVKAFPVGKVHTLRAAHTMGRVEGMTVCILEKCMTYRGTMVVVDPGWVDLDLGVPPAGRPHLRLHPI